MKSTRWTTVGRPGAIRTDNVIPFASPNALFGLSRLSVWWLRLGINIERIKPGHPEQNGRHERMHLTLKKEVTKPASYNFLQQQTRFDDFMQVYNNERPHQALGGRYPGDLYTPSTRSYRPPEQPGDPYHDRTIRVTQCGRICIGKRKINFSTVFAGQDVGIREVADQIWLVSFMNYDLGFFDEEEGRVEPPRTLFAGTVNHVSGIRCKPCLRNTPIFCMARLARFERATAWFVARYSIQLSYRRVGGVL